MAGLAAPTPREIKDWSQIPFGRYGAGSDEKLKVHIDRAVGYVLTVTGQKLDALDASGAPGNDAANLVPIMQQAIQMRVEQLVLQGRAGYATSAAEMDVIESFSAGSYTESRARGAFASRSGSAERSINKWPALAELLWQLMTPDRFDYWWAYTSGQAVSGFLTQEIDWRGKAQLFFEPWDLLPA